MCFVIQDLIQNYHTQRKLTFFSLESINTMSWYRLIITSVFVLVSLFGFAQSSEFVITGRFKIDGGSNNGAQIILEKDGRKVKTLAGDSRFEIGLDYQAIYIISFVKEGFVTKRLRFDTHVPEDRIEYGFVPFDFTIEIFEQFDEVNTVMFNQPVGKISFSDVIDEFDYDTDYTQSIQAKMEEAMEEVEVQKEEKAKRIAEEEKKNADLNKKVDNLTAAAQKSLSSGDPEDAIKKLEEAVELKDSPEIKQKLVDAKKELERKKIEAEEKAAAEAKAAEEEKAAAEAAAAAEKAAAEAKAKAEAEEKVAAEAQAKAEEEAKATAKAAKEAEEKAAAEAKAQAEAEEKAAAEAQAKAEEEAKAAAKAAKEAEEKAATEAKAQAEAEEKAAAEAQAKAEEEAKAGAKAAMEADEKAAAKAKAQAAAEKIAAAEAQAKAEKEAKAAAKEAEKKAEEEAMAKADAERLLAEKKKAEEAKKQEENLSEKEALEAAEIEKTLTEAISNGDALFKAGKLEGARDEYNKAIRLGAGDDIQEKIAKIDTLLDKQEEERVRAKEAAQAISNGARESDQLAALIDEEAIKQETKPKNDLSPEIESKPRESGSAKAVLESDEKPAYIAPGGAVIVSEPRVGKAAMSSPGAQMTEDDKYDSVLKQVEAQDVKMMEDVQQKRLMEKYPERKTVETEKAGTSTITYVYINRGDFVNVYKKVVHDWGGVFFFIDERPTNQRFWEHETN